VARNLLTYRHNQLGKAIEMLKNCFKNGAALYPMVTMNGEECHNEWEITFEEIHRNGAIALPFTTTTALPAITATSLKKALRYLSA
jgi:trehalose/maltose hydrolase-like predicted phosphorylase